MTLQAVEPAHPRVLAREECERLAHQVMDMVADCEAQVQIETTGKATMSFARGDSRAATDQESVRVSLVITTPAKQSASASTSRIDDEGLVALVAEARGAAKEHHAGEPAGTMSLQVYPEPPKMYFESTLEATTAAVQARAFHEGVRATDAADLIGAGDLSVELATRAMFNTRGVRIYERKTYAEFSLTARTKDGTGSGWGWSGFEDWSRVDMDAAVRRAVDLGRRSANPVAIEPGRYTVILEPTAVADLLEISIMGWSARWADGGGSLFSKQPPGTNKIGLRMIDSRLSMISDPWDPDLPTGVVGRLDWMPVPKPVVWIERGVLKNLEYDENYAAEKGVEPVKNPYTLRLNAAGPEESLADMIASTTRGVWVNRFSNVAPMNNSTQLQTGTTRDGTFLIENGKITKAIKNFRFTESPFFVLNKLEAAGTPVRASRTIVAPRLKVRDFDFTSLTDAV